MKYIKTGFVLFICLLIFGCLSFFLITVLFKFWSPVLLVIPKFSNSFYDVMVRCGVVLALTVLLCYLAGLLFSAKIRKSIPILKEMGDLKQRPFVLVKNYPSEGFWAIGIITGKQKFDDKLFDDKRLSRVLPRVYIPNPSNLISGHLIYPERHKLFPIDSSASAIFQMIVSMGILGPGTINLIDEVGIESYYV